MSKTAARMCMVRFRYVVFFNLQRTDTNLWLPSKLINYLSMDPLPLKGNFTSFGVNQAYEDECIPPQQGEKIGRVFHPFWKYIHSVYHVPGSNTILFLIPLILKFLYATISIFLPYVACPFQNISTNILWGYKWSGFVVWIIWWTDISINIKFIRGSKVLYSLGSIRYVLQSTDKDKNYLLHNLMIR